MSDVLRQGKGREMTPRLCPDYCAHGRCEHGYKTCQHCSECYAARKLAEEFRGPVMVLSDANLATGQQPFPKPEFDSNWLAAPLDLSPWEHETPPFAWDAETGLSRRPIPGQRGGEYVLTGLAHDEYSHVAYESSINQRAMKMRSRKLAVLQSALRPPVVHGGDEGELLVVGWGSTLGTIEEAVDRLREEGKNVSSVHLRFFSPMEPGLKAIFQRFRKVMTVEVNYSDDVGDPWITEESRRYSPLAQMLRSHTLTDVDCWSRVPGSPIPPEMIVKELRKVLDGMSGGEDVCRG
jgi:2-oxoglutarate ferredoxin oxidoreductase subunit alpha